MNKDFQDILQALINNQKLNENQINKVYDIEALIKYMVKEDISLENWHQLIISFYIYGKHTQFYRLASYVTNSIIEKIPDLETNKGIKIRIINTLASYCLVQLIQETDRITRDKLSNEVVLCTKKSDKLNVNEFSSFVLKGFMLFFQGNIDTAYKYFENAEIVLSEKSLTAKLGKAIIEFCRRNYREALKLFKDIIRIYPNVPTHVRLGLGYCFFNLDKISFAEKCFNGILNKEPENVEAIVGLAIIKKKQQAYKEYFDLLEKGFKINRNNLLILLELAEHYVYKEEFTRAKKLATQALNILQRVPQIDPQDKSRPQKLKLDSLELKSRLQYILGYYHHQNKNYEMAKKYYLFATQSYKLNYPAQFQLAQIHIYDRSYTEALNCLESILKTSTDIEVGECYRVLGYVCSKLNYKNETMEYYEKAIKFDSHDYECMLEYALYLETIDSNQALTIYQNAFKIMQELNEETNGKVVIHPELYNNIGILKQKKGDFEEAKKDLNKALELVESKITEGLSDSKYPAIKLSILFNLANLTEEMGDTIESSNLYKKIISENPYYIDAYLRLGNIYFKRGNMPKAIEYCERSLEIIDNSKQISRSDRFKSKFTDALCAKGYFLLQFGEENRALTNFAKVKSNSNEDSFAKISQASIEYNISIAFRDKPLERKRFIKGIVETSRQIISIDENNMYAALLIGICLAENRNLKEAKEIFNSILEGSPQNSMILINLAHIEFLNLRYENAIQIYQSYLSKKYNQYDEEIETMLALCYLLSKKYKEGQRILQKLIIKYPENLLHRFNLCSLLYEYAFDITKQTNRNIEDTKDAIKYTKLILPIFNFLCHDHYGHTTRVNYESIQEMKKKKETLFESMEILSDQKYYLLHSNIRVFENKLKEDEENHRIKENLLEEKRRKRELLEKEKMNHEEEIRRKLKDKEEDEKAIRLIEMARNLHESLQKKESDGENGDKKGGHSTKKKRKNKKKTKEEIENFIDDTGAKTLGQEMEENYALDEKGAENVSEIFSDIDQEEEVYMPGDEIEKPSKKDLNTLDEERRHKKAKKLKKLKKHKEKLGYEEGVDQEELENPTYGGDDDVKKEDNYEYDKPQKKRKLRRLKERNMFDENNDNIEDILGESGLAPEEGEGEGEGERRIRGADNIKKEMEGNDNDDNEEGEKDEEITNTKVEGGDDNKDNEEFSMEENIL